MSEREMTVDSGKITNTTLIIYDVLSDYEKHVLLKTLIKCLRLLYMF